MTPEPLTDAERDFLRDHDGGLAGALAALSGGATPTPKTAAADAAAGVVAAVAQRYPSRTERLLVLTALAHATAVAKEALLDELLCSEFHWSYHPDKEVAGQSGWCSMALQPRELRQLASLVGLNVAAVRRRYRLWCKATLDEAVAAAGVSREAAS